MEVKVGFFSDTHCMHNEWKDNFDSFEHGDKIKEQWDDLDILIFTGDCSGRGSERDTDEFMNWFNLQPATQKVMIAGNHDFFFDIELRSKTRRHSWESAPEEAVAKMLAKYPHIHYLNDSGVNLYGVNIWGSPVQPAFGQWAFNRVRNTEINTDGSTVYLGPTIGGIEPHWAKAPKNTDIFLGHGPPFGHGDLLAHKFRRSGEYPRVGCVDMLNAINRVQPQIVAFGHIHEGYSKVIGPDGIIYINASSVNENYRPTNAPKFHTLTVK
jgi:Icc-related predicted phosphoesterase